MPLELSYLWIFSEILNIFHNFGMFSEILDKRAHVYGYFCHKCDQCLEICCETVTYWSSTSTYILWWYDMIWFYLHKIAAQRPNYNVQYKTREKKNTQYDQKQSWKYNNRQQRNKAKLWSRWAKKKIESKKSNYGSLLLIWDWTTSISISASTRLGEFGIVLQLPTMYLKMWEATGSESYHSPTFSWPSDS